MRISKVWVDDHSLYAATTDGLTASYDFSRWPRLRDARPEQQAQFELSYSGIHWPAINEDLSFEGMFHAAGLCDTSENEYNVCYLSIA